MSSIYELVVILVMSMAAMLILLAILATVRWDRPIKKIGYVIAMLLLGAVIGICVQDLLNGAKYLVLERHGDLIVVQNLDNGKITSFDVDKSSKVEPGDVTIGQRGAVFIDGDRLSKAYMTADDTDTSVTKNIPPS